MLAVQCDMVYIVFSVVLAANWASGIEARFRLRQPITGAFFAHDMRAL